MATKTEIDLSEKIILRNVRGKVGLIKIMPCRNPETGRFPDCVKPVDSKGDMILSEKELNDPDRKYFVAENDVFDVVDGTTFNLANRRERFVWEAIKNCPLIAPDMYAKDSKGNSLINGDSRRYGIAELYIERPGVESVKRISAKKLKHKAESFIYDDERGYDGRVLKARLLGHKMTNMPDADVTDFLLQIAEKDPQRIINLYTGGDTAIRLLFIEAREKKVIVFKDKVYLYADNVILGASDEAAILYLKDPKNAKIVSLIKRETYPDLVDEEPLNKKSSKKD